MGKVLEFDNNSLLIISIVSVLLDKVFAILGETFNKTLRMNLSIEYLAVKM